MTRTEDNVKKSGTKLVKKLAKAVKAAGKAAGTAQLEAAPALAVAPEAVPVAPGLVIETPSAAAGRVTTGRRIIPGLDPLLAPGVTRAQLIEAEQGPQRGIVAYFPDEPGPRSQGPGRKTRAALYACGHGGPGPDGLGELCHMKPNGTLYVTKTWRCRRCRDGAPVSEANAKMLADVIAAREANGGRIVLIRTGGSLKGSIPEGVSIA